MASSLHCPPRSNGRLPSEGNHFVLLKKTIGPLLSLLPFCIPVPIAIRVQPLTKSSKRAEYPTLYCCVQITNLMNLYRLLSEQILKDDDFRCLGHSIHVPGSFALYNGVMRSVIYIYMTCMRMSLLHKVFAPRPPQAAIVMSDAVTVLHTTSQTRSLFPHEIVPVDCVGIQSPASISGLSQKLLCSSISPALSHSVN